jgi:hypothetical protein
MLEGRSRMKMNSTVGPTHFSLTNEGRTGVMDGEFVASVMELFYIYFITILQKYMVRHKFCKNIHLPLWPTASGT